jgi:hypothetical protein
MAISSNQQKQGVVAVHYQGSSWCASTLFVIYGKRYDMHRKDVGLKASLVLHKSNKKKKKLRRYSTTKDEQFFAPPLCRQRISTVGVCLPPPC